VNLIPAPAIRRNLPDGVAIAMSGVCLLHCLALPLLVALAPALSRWLDLPEALQAVTPFSLIILWKASRSRPRGSSGPLILGLAGLTVMTCGIWLEGLQIEPFVSGSGAVLLAAADVKNWRIRSKNYLSGTAI